MSRRLIFNVVFAMLALGSSPLIVPNVSSTTEPTRTCKTNPNLVAACFRVHGRLGWYNGAPSGRIWIIGTKRMLGLHDDWIPANMESRSGPDFDREVFGDFDVCPFTKETAGEMQMVCIESASHIVFKERDKVVQQ
jgi:hypothetical protein